MNLLERKIIITKKEANCVKSIVQKRGHLYKREAKSVGERVNLHVHREKRCQLYKKEASFHRNEVTERTVRSII